MVGRRGLFHVPSACCCNKTPQFQEALKRVEKRQHDLSQILDEEGRPAGGQRKVGRKAAKKVDDFEKKGKSIVENVTRLKQFLAENRNAYVDVLNNECLPDPITDLDRDSIDAGAHNFIRTSNKLISGFKSELKSQLEHLSPQRIQHLEAVTDILDEYLRSVCAIHSKQKAIRIEKELEVQKLSRLEVDARKRSHPEAPISSDQDFAADLDEDTEDDEVLPEVRNKRRLKKSSSSTGTDKKTSPDNGYLYSSDDENEQSNNQPGSSFSPEEIQSFERENDALYEDLISLKDNVQQIQSKVVKIAELQEVFTEKVLQQKDDIDLIADNAVATTENVKDGNEELRKAIQRNASIRVYILFFLIVMSFSLLFLDWYND